MYITIVQNNIYFNTYDTILYCHFLDVFIYGILKKLMFFISALITIFKQLSLGPFFNFNTGPLNVALNVIQRLWEGHVLVLFKSQIQVLNININIEDFWIYDHYIYKPFTNITFSFISLTQFFILSSFFFQLFKNCYRLEFFH